MVDLNEPKPSSQDDAMAMAELVGFLEPSTRVDVRRTALDVVISLSGALDGSAGRLFMSNGCAMGTAICKLCESTLSDRSHTLTALTNFSSASAEVADFILKKSKCTQLAYDYCRAGAALANVSARLLTNLSRHFPDRVDEQLTRHDPDALVVLAGECPSRPISSQ
ncbi:unnamed protein product [Heligmosomoides polygyrus]|uniref:Protein AMN1 homolog n=1 Tax=Heligmosomoides polygyrus TaxID=6339 RepID=A0A183GPU1_HELPZ|nr:unnamed protein product [Heligmosomoides polygyrus]